MPCYVAWAQKPTKRISIRSPITCLFSGCIFLRDISKTFKYNLIGLLISNRLSSAHLCIHSILCAIKHKICLFCWVNIFLWLYMMISTDKHYIKLSNRLNEDNLFPCYRNSFYFPSLIYCDKTHWFYKMLKYNGQYALFQL